MLALTESNDVFGAVVSDPEARQDLCQHFYILPLSIETSGPPEL
jgi:hypothetical protein